jgi:hypothetical protein
MKVLLINGSPHEKGCTYTALSLIAGGSTRDEDGLALRRVGNAAAVAGKTLDAEGEKLVFL